MGTLIEEIFSRRAGRTVQAGEILLLDVDYIMSHDNTTPLAIKAFREIRKPILDKSKIVLHLDHAYPAPNVLAAENHRKIMDFVKEQELPYLFSQGVCHQVMIEEGFVTPGSVIIGADSHSNTYGAMGAFGTGLGSTEIGVAWVTGKCWFKVPETIRVELRGQTQPGVYAKDVILTIIRRLGVQGGVGFAYEYGGTTLDAMTIDERLTVCNMSIEGGARVGYVNPDETTFAYLRGRPFAPAGDAFERAVQWWRQMASDPDARYDDRVTFDAASIEPTVTWGINPGQSVGVSEPIAGDPADEAFAFMGFTPGRRVTGTKIDVAFIGSCTNGRLSDLEEAARLVRGHRVAKHVTALVVPGSQAISRAAEARGLDQVFRQAGFEWRGAGCSMCLGMNPDRLEGRQVCASSSNRNFKGRQGSPTGRTLLMSPAMVAAAAIAGEVVDVRTVLEAVPA